MAIEELTAQPPEETDEGVSDNALALVPPFARAQPGQSLTNDPDSPAPFEGQPEFTNLQDALGYVLNNLLQADAIKDVVQSLSKGVPVSELAYMIVYEGFRTGKWNPDLMMMLAEPLMYVLLYIAERADVDVVVYTGEQDEEYDDLEGADKLRSMNSAQRAIKERSKLQEIEKGIPNLDAVLPTELADKVESLVPSLLAEPEPTAPQGE